MKEEDSDSGAVKSERLHTLEGDHAEAHSLLEFDSWMDEKESTTTQIFWAVVWCIMVAMHICGTTPKDGKPIDGVAHALGTIVLIALGACVLMCSTSGVSSRTLGSSRPGLSRCISTNCRRL
ncbi:unnamed protein product [Symbiodinium sp. CCMP2456]|nr:unnamed protein product [Symbiodinium sp. CCMP2456]